MPMKLDVDISKVQSTECRDEISIEQLKESRACMVCCVAGVHMMMSVLTVCFILSKCIPAQPQN